VKDLAYKIEDAGRAVLVYAVFGAIVVGVWELAWADSTESWLQRGYPPDPAFMQGTDETVATATP
jgi:hypothetical protein